MNRILYETLNHAETINKYLLKMRSVLYELPIEDISHVVAAIQGARLNGNNVFIFGNGGSASTASHFANDLSKGTISQGKPRIKAISLVDNIALICAWANDASYDNVFAEQLENLIKPGDIVIGISGSGNSKNVINAIELAKEKKAITIGFSGFDGGRLKEIADIDVIAPCDNIEQVEDIHLMFVHIITTCLKNGAW